MKVKNYRLKEIMDQFTKLGMTRNVGHRIKIARILTVIKVPLEEYEFATKPSDEMLAYEDQKRMVYNRFGESRVGQGGQVQLMVQPEKREDFEQAMADLKTRYINTFSDEADRAAGVREVAEQEVELKLETGIVKAGWLGDFIDANGLSVLMEFGLISDEELDRVLMEEEK